MENASNALLIGGGILIAMLILSMGVQLFMTYSDLGESYEQTLEVTEIQKFNSNFTKFEGREDITIQEIVSLVNFVKEYNNETGTNIEVKITSTSYTKKDNENLINEIKTNTEEKYKCNNIQYEEATGLVNSIQFNKTE